MGAERQPQLTQAEGLGLAQVVDHAQIALATLEHDVGVQAARIAGDVDAATQRQVATPAHVGLQPVQQAGHVDGLQFCRHGQVAIGLPAQGAPVQRGAGQLHPAGRGLHRLQAAVGPQRQRGGQVLRLQPGAGGR